jgi:hypothetical protein
MSRGVRRLDNCDHGKAGGTDLSTRGQDGTKDATASDLATRDPIHC